jgi:hypothetical protein
MYVQFMRMMNFRPDHPFGLIDVIYDSSLGLLLDRLLLQFLDVLFRNLDFIPISLDLIYHLRRQVHLSELVSGKEHLPQPHCRWPVPASISVCPPSRVGGCLPWHPRIHHPDRLGLLVVSVSI